MSLVDSIRQMQNTKPRGPVWEGPSGDGPNGGVTQSLLGRFLGCRERFRLLVVEGLKPNDSFSHRLEYGNLWHVCEEALARGNDPTRGNRESRKSPLWEAALLEYAQQCARRYPMQQEQVDHWYNVCRVQFPEYVRFWAKHADVTGRTPLLQEQEFSVPYKLPSGRTVRLRGKWDSVDVVGKEIWLMENKTKSEVKEEQLRRQLMWDLQTQFYLIALKEWREQDDYGVPVRFPAAVESPIAGVRYNVIRRPLSGGKGTIVRNKATAGAKCPKCKGTGTLPYPSAKAALVGNACFKCHGQGRTGGKPEETREHFYERVAEYIRKEPETYFFRWNVRISSDDITRFRRECLDPVLENLVQWYDWVTTQTCDAEVLARNCNWRLPFGVNIPLLEGGTTDLDAHLLDGSTIGLQRATNLFPELTGQP